MLIVFKKKSGTEVAYFTFENYANLKNLMKQTIWVKPRSRENICSGILLNIFKFSMILTIYTITHVLTHFEVHRKIYSVHYSKSGKNQSSIFQESDNAILKVDRF